MNKFNLLNNLLLVRSSGAVKYVESISAKRKDPRHKCPGYDTKQSDPPVSWGCRICRLHLYKGFKKTNEVTCLPLVATRMALGRNLGVWLVIDPSTEWWMTSTTLFWLLLGLTGGLIGPIRSSDGPVEIYHTYVYLLPNLSLNLLLRNDSEPFILYMHECVGWGSLVLREKSLNRCYIVES